LDGGGDELKKALAIARFPSWLTRRGAVQAAQKPQKEVVEKEVVEA